MPIGDLPVKRDIAENVLYEIDKVLEEKKPGGNCHQIENGVETTRFVPERVLTIVAMSVSELRNAHDGKGSGKLNHVDLSQGDYHTEGDAG